MAAKCEFELYLQTHQELNKQYDTLCASVVEKCRFVYYCLHCASGRKKRATMLEQGKLQVSRWQDAVAGISVANGTFWEMEKWRKIASSKRDEDIPAFDEEFAGNVANQLLDFVCDESLNLDMLRKCFLYQVRIP